VKAQGLRAGTAIDVAFVVARRRWQPSDSAASGFGLDRLRAELAAQGVQIVRSCVITGSDRSEIQSRLATALRWSAPDHGQPVGIALLDADLVINAPPLGAVLDDPRVGTGALSVAEGGELSHLGVLKLDAADRSTAAEFLREASAGPHETDRDTARDASVTTVDTEVEDVLCELTQKLTTAGVPVRAVPLGGYAWARAVTPAAAADAVTRVEAVDERTVRLREAARGGDGFYSTFVLRRISWRLTSVAERLGLTPNQVTLISFGLGLLAAGLLAIGDRSWSVLGAVLLQVCLVVDCVDGELARYRRRFSRFGAWLDATTDRIKEFAAIAALAVAGSRSGHDLWFLAAAAIGLQTFRNLLDLGWASQRAAVTALSGVRLASPRWVSPATVNRVPAPRPSGPGALSWAKRIGHFPIGERFLLISLGAAVWTPRATLIALLCAGGAAGVYLLVAFGLRSHSGPDPRGQAGPGRSVGLADAGPVLQAVLRAFVGDRPSRAAAMLPALVAAAELALTWWLAVAVGGARPAAVLVLVAVVAIAHYQHAYGVREDGRDDTRWVLGTDLRLLLVVLLIAIPGQIESVAGTWSTGMVWGLAALVALTSTARSLRVWTGDQTDQTDGTHPPARTPERAEMIGGQR
jgi:phosphatidylglycerophosphate synthase